MEFVDTQKDLVDTEVQSTIGQRIEKSLEEFDFVPEIKKKIVVSKTFLKYCYKITIKVNSF